MLLYSSFSIQGNNFRSQLQYEDGFFSSDQKMSSICHNVDIMYYDQKNSTPSSKNVEISQMLISNMRRSTVAAWMTPKSEILNIGLRFLLRVALHGGFKVLPDNSDVDFSR